MFGIGRSLALHHRAAGSKTAKPAFVELIVPAVPRVDEYLIEFESSRGPKMRIQWKGVSPTGMLAAAGLNYRRCARTRLSIMEKQ